MRMARAGAVWVDVIPNMAAFGTSIRAGARLNLSSFGAQSGKDFASGLNASTKAGMTEFATTVKVSAGKAAAAVESASIKAAAAAARQENAAGRVRVAQLQLLDVQRKAAESAVKLAEAQGAEGVSAAALAKAQETAATSSLRLAGAQERAAAAARADVIASTGAAKAGAALAKAQESAALGVGASADVAGARFAGLGSRVESTGRKATSAISGIGKQVLGLGTVFAGFAAVDFLSKSVQHAADFQKQMMLLVTAGGEASSNLGLVSNGIKTLAVSTGTSTTDLASGMYVMEKAGLRGANGLKVLKAAAQGAKDENANLGVVTNALTSVMRSYNLPAAQANSVMNQMVVAAGESKTSMENFAGSLSTVMPLASSAGISFAQVGGAIATLTSHGTSADQATQDLAFTIRSLQAPNNVATLAMTQLGLNSQDVASRLGKRGLTGTIEMLSNTVLHQMGPSGQVLLRTLNNSKVAALDAQQMFQRLPPAAQAAARGFMSGDLTLKAFRHTVMGMPAPVASLAAQWAATENKSKGFNQQLRSGNQASLTYTAMMKKVMGGAAGWQTALMLTGGSAGFFNRAVGAIGASAKTTGSDITAWKMAQETFNVQLDRFKQSVNVAGITIGTALLPPLTRLAGWLANTVPQVVHFVQANQNLIKPLAYVAGGMVALSIATAAFSAVLQTNALVWILDGVVALGVGLVIAYKKSQTFRDIVQGVFHGIMTVAGAYGRFFAGPFNTFLVTGLHGIMAAAGAVGRFFAGPFAGFFKAGFGAVKGAVVSVKNAVLGAWTAVRGGTVTAWSAVTGAVGGAARGIESGVHAVGAAAVWLWRSAFVPAANAIGAAAQTLWSRVIHPVFTEIAALATWMGRTVYNVGLLIHDLFVYVVSKAVTFLWENSIHPVFTEIAALATWLYRSAILPMWDGIKLVLEIWGTTTLFLWNKYVNPVFTGIGNLATWVGGKARSLWSDYISPAFTAIGGGAKYLWDRVISPTFTAIGNFISTTLPDKFSYGAGKIGGWIDKLGGYAKSAWDYMRPIFVSIGDAVKTKLVADFKSAVGLIKLAWDGLQAVVKAPVKFVLDTVLNGGLIPAFNWVAGKIGSSAHIDPFPLPKGFSTGGRVDGPGTSTSDSISARLSKGEFVVNAAATAQHLPVLAAINGGVGNGGNRFRSGGLVGGIEGAWNAVKGVGQDIASAMTDPTALLTRLVSKVVGGGTGGATAQLGQLVRDVPKYAISEVIGTLQSAIGSLFGGGGGGIADGPAIVSAARKFIGVPYLWGGTEPGGFDCSGLVQYILGKFNVHAPRTAAQQGAWATPEPARAAGIGDLVFFDQPTGHVGINEGNGRMIDAPHTGAFVREESIWPGARYGRIPGMAARPGAPGAGGPGGGGAGMPTGDMVTRWAPLVAQTLGELGLAQSGGMVARVLRQIKTESGGDPNATQGNIGDVNNRTGDLGRGLMQVIRATFDAYAGPTRPFGQYNPHASIYAGLNYDSHKGGGNPGLSDLGQGHGYDTGGLWPSGSVGFNRSGGKERVLNPTQTQHFEAAMNRVGAVASAEKEKRQTVVRVEFRDDRLKDLIDVRIDESHDAHATLLAYGTG